MVKKSTAQLQADLLTSFPDNMAKSITAAILRAQQTDLTDSFQPFTTIVPVTGNAAVGADTESGSFFRSTSANPNTLAIGPGSSFTEGFSFYVYRDGAGDLTITPSGTDTINGSNSSLVIGTDKTGGLIVYLGSGSWLYINQIDDFSNVPENTFLIVDAMGHIKPSSMREDPTKVVLTKPFQVPPGTLLLGPETFIGAAIRAVSVRSGITGNTGLLLAQLYSKANGFERASVYGNVNDPATDTVSLNDPLGTDTADTAQFSMTTTADEMLIEVRVRTSQNSATIPFMLRVRTGSHAGPDAFLLDGTLDTNALGVATIELANDHNPILVDSGTELFFTINCSGMLGVLSGGVFVPNADIDRIVTVRDPIAAQSDLAPIEADVSELQTNVDTLNRTAFNSGRSFLRFNDGFTIDRTNIATYEGRNSIYTAKNDKPFDSATRPDINLPDDTEIQAAGESYPVVFEFLHLGGTAVFTGTNVVRFFVDGTEVHRILRDQVTVIVKESAGAAYAFTSGAFDPNDTLLPTGVFNLKTDTVITDISTIATELSAVSIVAGDAFRVVTGGTWSAHTIPSNSVLVALVSSPSLVDSPDNNDWLLLDNGRVNAMISAFFANVEQDGVRFNTNRNIQIDPSNVAEVTNVPSGVPVARQVGSNSQGSGSVRYDNAPILFSDIVGGSLRISMSFSTTTTGFLPSWDFFRIEYPGGIQFDFPLTGAPINGTYTTEISIPNVDYSSAINQTPSITLFYTFNGAQFLGTFTVQSLMNLSQGRLNSIVTMVAEMEALKVESRVQAQIDDLKGGIAAEDASLGAIADRISPYVTLTNLSPDVFARFLDSTGSDNFPASIDDLTQVSSISPRFTGGASAMFVAVRSGGNRIIQNITQNTETPLDTSEPTVDLGESIVASDGFVYFVYRVTGLVSGDIYEIESTAFVQVPLWSNEIENLQEDGKRRDALLDHAILGLSDEVINVMEHDLGVVEESNPVVSPSAYNASLGDTGTQTVFTEPSPNTPASGSLSSNPIEDSTADRQRSKLVYIDESQVYANQTYLTAFDGTASVDLVSYLEGTFFAKVFAPLIPASTSLNDIYPGPQNQVSGKGIWINIPALTFVNGEPETEADAAYFVRNLPHESTDLTIQYRAHSNGNPFGNGSIVLGGVGGDSEVATSFTLNSGSETAFVEVRYFPNFNGGGKTVRVSVTESVNNGLPTINDIEVILSWQESRTVPAVPASVRDVAFEGVSAVGGQVFAIKASTTGTLILVGSLREVDTGYLYTDIFDTDESGHLVLLTENGVFYDYQDFEPIPSTIVELENRSALPRFGLFTVNYTHETVLTLDTQLSVKDRNNIARRVGDAPTVTSGTAAPTTIPVKVGDMFVDTNNKTVYVAVGAETASNWEVLN